MKSAACSLRVWLQVCTPSAAPGPAWRDNGRTRFAGCARLGYSRLR